MKKWKHRAFQVRYSLDCNPVFRDHTVEPEIMLLIMLGSVVGLGSIYLIITAMPEKR